jgi:hypothetical protein
MIHCIQEYADHLLVVFILRPSLTPRECLLSNDNVLIKGHLDVLVASQCMTLSFDSPDQFDHYRLASSFALGTVHLVADHHLLIGQVIVALEVDPTHIHTSADASEEVEDFRLSLLNEGSAGVEGFLGDEEALFESANGIMRGGFLQVNTQLVLGMK